MQAPGIEKSTSTHVRVTVHGLPNRLYNEGIEGKDMWEEVSRFFVKATNKKQHMNLTKFYTDGEFGLLINLRSMPNQTMHGRGTCLVNTNDGVQLELEWKGRGSGNVNCHVFVIRDLQMNIMEQQFVDVHY